MSDVLELYRELQEHGAYLYNWEMSDELATTIELGGNYALFIDTSRIETEAEEAVVVGHEGGHIMTGATHQVCSPYDLVSKHEHKANAWAYRRLLSPERLAHVRRSGYRQPWEIAEQLNLPQWFIEDAVAYYKTQPVQ